MQRWSEDPGNERPDWLRVWWLAIRPKTLWAAVAPVVIGLAMAADAGGLRPVAAALTLLASVLVQIGTNLANDVSDFLKGADTKNRKGPTRATQAGWVSPRGMMAATAIAFGGAALASVYLVWIGGWPIVVIAVASILSGIGYTAGPFPLGYNGLGDVFVLVFFGPVAVGGTYYLQTGAVTPGVLIAGLAPGLLSTAILVVNNLRDIDEDRDAGKRTLAVRFGRRFARAQYAACLLFSALVPPVLIVVEGWYHGTLIASLALVVLGVPLLRTIFRETDAAKLNPALGGTARLLILYSVFFSVAWVLAHP